jgi:nitrogen fixation protein FixH
MSEVRGRHVLAGMVLFFAVIFAVDGAFMYFAIRTFPGQTVDNPYEAGLAYNRTLEVRRAQAALGWRAEVEPGEAGVIDVAFRDREGRPVTGLDLSAKLERPATEAGRIEPAFHEVGPGLYRTSTGAAPGGWDLTVSAADKAGRSFGFEHRLVWR